MAARIQKTVDIHGYALRAVREAQGRKVAALAEALTVDRSYIAHIENGTRRRVSVEFYNRLLNELHITERRALLAVAPLRDEVVDLDAEATPMPAAV